MDHEALFTATKWELLKLLETSPRSPLELSALTRCSLANVSQQLRLLEMAGLVESQRVPNREKGQPRMLYRLAGNNCYVISASSSLVEKRRLRFSPSNLIQLKIWFLENPEVRMFVEKAFWRIEGFLPRIAAICVDIDSVRPVSLYIVPQGGRLDIDEIQELRHGDETRQLVIVQERAERLREYEGLFPLYDPENILGR